MTPENLIHEFYKIGVIKTGEFTLKSGAVSPIYFDLRILISYPILLKKVADELWIKIKDLNSPLLCGVPYAALPIATAISINHHIPMIMRRKEKKEYGTKNKIEGVFKPGQSCLVIEDVVTSGASVLETVDDLHNENLKVTHVVAVLDREEGGFEKLHQQGFILTSLLKKNDILVKLKHATRYFS